MPAGTKLNLALVVTMVAVLVCSEFPRADAMSRVVSRQVPWRRLVGAAAGGSTAEPFVGRPQAPQYGGPRASFHTTVPAHMAMRSHFAPAPPPAATEPPRTGGAMWGAIRGMFDMAPVPKVPSLATTVTLGQLFSTILVPSANSDVEIEGLKWNPDGGGGYVAAVDYLGDRGDVGLGGVLDQTRWGRIEAPASPADAGDPHGLAAVEKDALMRYTKNTYTAVNRLLHGKRLGGYEVTTDPDSPAEFDNGFTSAKETRAVAVLLREAYVVSSAINKLSRLETTKAVELLEAEGRGRADAPLKKPVYRGTTLTRAEVEGLRVAFEEKAPASLDSFLSASERRSVAEKFIEIARTRGVEGPAGPDGAVPVLLTVQAGRTVDRCGATLPKGASAFDNEKEVLFNPRTKFDVTSMELKHTTGSGTDGDFYEITLTYNPNHA